MASDKLVPVKKRTKKAWWNFKSILQSGEMEIVPKRLHEQRVHFIEFPSIQRGTLAYFYETLKQEIKEKEKACP